MIDIALLGPTTVRHDGRTYTAGELGGGKPRQVLEMLALEPGSLVPKEMLAERLWDGHPPASYIATLESYVCQLRRRLGFASGRQAQLATSNKCYVLDPEQVRVDLVVARTMLSTGSPEGVENILDTVTGHLLDSDPFAAWAQEERVAFDEDVAAACLRVAPMADAAGAEDRAVRLARAAVQRNEFSESARQVLMRALWHAGERTQGLLTYADLRARMLEELGIEPGRVTQDLYVEILRDGVGAASRGVERIELRLLVRLLKETLESGTRVERTAADGVAEVGTMLLAACGAQPSW